MRIGYLDIDNEDIVPTFCSDSLEPFETASDWFMRQGASTAEAVDKRGEQFPMMLATAAHWRV